MFVAYISKISDFTAFTLGLNRIDRVYKYFLFIIHYCTIMHIRFRSNYCSLSKRHNRQKKKYLKSLMREIKRISGKYSNQVLLRNCGIILLGKMSNVLKQLFIISTI